MIMITNKSIHNRVTKNIASKLDNALSIFTDYKVETCENDWANTITITATRKHFTFLTMPCIEKILKVLKPYIKKYSNEVVGYTFDTTLRAKWVDGKVETEIIPCIKIDIKYC